MSTVSQYVKGSFVILRKGSVVRSTNPSKSEYTLTRKQKVKVHSYYPALPKGYDYHGWPAQIHWVGTGGYWCWTEAANVVEG